MNTITETQLLESSIPPPDAKPPDRFRVLHTADWHLGKLLGERSRLEEHRRFLAFLLDRIAALSVNALVIAGDLFDSANPPQSAVAQYYDFLSALFRQGGCSVVVVAGNHDSPAHLEAPRQVLRALRAHVVGVMPDPVEGALIPLPSAENPRLVVAAVPFLRDRDLRQGEPGQGAAEIQRELVAGIKRRYAEAAEASRPWLGRGLPVLATGHLTVVGAVTSDSEREIHIGGQGAVAADCFPEGFAYVALGHLHRPQRVGHSERVRYAGSPIELSFSEAGDAKELRLLDFAEGRLLAQSAVPIPRFRPLAQVNTTAGGIEADLRQFTPPPGELPAWVEVVVTDPPPGENLFDRVQRLVEARNFEVVRVVGRRGNPLEGMTAPAGAEADDLGVLLGNPASIFARRLAAEDGLSEPEREALSGAFRELLDLHETRVREPEAVA